MLLKVVEYVLWGEGKAVLLFPKYKRCVQDIDALFNHWVSDTYDLGLRLQS